MHSRTLPRAGHRSAAEKATVGSGRPRDAGRPIRPVEDDLSLIDLDLVPERPAQPGPGLQAYRRPLSLVAALLAGAVAGGSVTYRVVAAQRQAAAATAVSMVAVAEAPPGAPEDAVSSVVGHGRIEQVRFSGRVTVVNAGPEPIDVRIFAVRGDRVAATSADWQRWIDPATSSSIEVDVTFACGGNAISLGPAADVTVETANRSAKRVLPVAFDSGPWLGPLLVAMQRCHSTD